MKTWSALVFLCITTAGYSTPVSPCENPSGWRVSVCDFARGHLVHSAWGYEHGLRDYMLALEIAGKEGIAIDLDVLFAAALLHDMGGFVPYEKPGVDHAVRSTEVVEAVLKPAGFPMEKLDAVKNAILTHSYYDSNPPQGDTAVLLHDADVLDFMGNVSIMRLLSIVGKEPSFKDVKSAVALLEKFESTLTGKLYGGLYTKKLGADRKLEMQKFLESLKVEAFGFGIP